MKRFMQRFLVFTIALFAIIQTIEPINAEAKTGYHTSYCSPGCQSSSTTENHPISDHGTVDFWDYCGACGQYARHWRRSWGYDCNGTYHETAAQVNIYAGTYDKGLYCAGTSNPPNGGAQSGTVPCSSHTSYWCPGHEKPNTYYISFNANGGVGSMSKMTCTYDKTHTLTANTFTKKDYELAGWATASNGKVVYTDKQSIINLTATNGATITLYAVWQPVQRSLTINGQIDGTNIDNFSAYGYTGLYINGNMTEKSVGYLSRYFEYGSKYELFNTKANPGYTYVGVAEGTTSGTLNDNKTVRLKFITNRYLINVRAGTGIQSVSGGGNLLFNTQTSINAVVKPGYTWKNWTGYTTTTTQNYSFRVPAAPATFTANATPNTDTPYKVEHYLQNINDNNYTLHLTEPFTGTTDTSVTPAVKSYTGFTSPAAQTVNINGDGTTVVKYYYTRNSYKVTLNAGTGIQSVSGAGTYKYGATVKIDAVVKTGYTWKNWTGYATTTTKAYSFTLPAQDVSFTANATANTYYVAYVKGLTNGGGTVATTSHTYDKDVTLAANQFIGRSYTVNFNPNRPDTIGQVQGMPSMITGNLTFNQWQVKATNNSGNYAAAVNLGAKNFEHANGATATATALWNNTTVTWGNPTLIGYDFNGWKNSANVKMSSNNLTIAPATTQFTETYTATWVPRDDTKYVVYHWVQNIEAESDEHNSTNFTLKDTDNLEGTSDSYVTPEVKKYEGCVPPPKVTVRIQADGSTVVNYYYERIKLSLSVDGEYLQVHYPTTDGLATFDVYINGKLKANDVTDYYNNKILYGSTWYINDIKAKSGKHYSGTDIQTLIE